MAEQRDAGVLRCPGCGANVAPDARRCPYCEARLATISCPSCFALMFDSAAFCPACGARRARTAAGGLGAGCPGCRAEMERVELASTVLLECHACDAVWVDAPEFERLCAEVEAQAAILHHIVPTGAPREGVPVRYRPCVRCGKLMNRVNFGQISGTVVDVCRGHGTFLDAGELHAIVTFIRGGGLELARKRRIEELKNEERRLEERRLRAARQPDRRHALDRRERSGGLFDASASLVDFLDLISGK